MKKCIAFFSIALFAVTSGAMAKDYKSAINDLHTALYELANRDTIGLEAFGVHGKRLGKKHINCHTARNRINSAANLVKDDKPEWWIARMVLSQTINMETFCDVSNQKNTAMAVRCSQKYAAIEQALNKLQNCAEKIPSVITEQHEWATVKRIENNIAKARKNLLHIHPRYHNANGTRFNLY